MTFPLRLSVLSASLSAISLAALAGIVWGESGRPAGTYYAVLHLTACPSIKTLNSAPSAVKIVNGKAIFPVAASYPDEFRKLGCRTLADNETVLWDGKTTFDNGRVIGKITTSDGAELFVFSNFLNEMPMPVHQDKKPSGQPRDLDEGERRIIIDAIAPILRDPDSAKYKLPKFTGATVYCGQLNAKNGYGGYNGYALFTISVTSDDNGKVTAADSPVLRTADDAFTRAFVNICKGNGYP